MTNKKNELKLVEERLRKRFEGRIVFGSGNANARIMLVGEAPGRSEEKLGIPFVGRAGKLLDEALQRAEIRREELYVTNVVKHRPPNNRKPKAGEVREFLPFLKLEIEVVKPEVVCLLGSTALEALLGKRYAVSKDRGKIIEAGRKFLVSYHPAAVLRNPKLKKVFESDIKKLKRFA